MYAYGSSKAALNYVTRALAFELRDQGIIVIPLSPGWVKTDMGGEDALIDPDTSAGGIVRTIETLTMSDTSQWFTWDSQRRTEW